MGKEKNAPATYSAVAIARLVAASRGLVLIIAGAIVGELTWLANIFTLVPSTCEVQHLAASLEKELFLLAFFSSWALLPAMAAWLMPSLSAYFRSERNRKSFPKKGYIPVGDDFKGMSECDLRDRLYLYEVLVVTSLLCTVTLIFSIFYILQYDSAAQIHKRWSSYVKACHAPAELLEPTEVI